MATTITWNNSETGQNIVVTIPPELEAMLTWIFNNTFLPQYPYPNPPGTTPTGEPPQKRYLHVPNVLYRDVLDILVPRWKTMYSEGQLATLKEQIAAQEAALDAQIKQAVDTIVVV